MQNVTVGQMFAEVLNSDLGVLMCLGCEVFGRWSDEIIKLTPDLAFSKSEFYPALLRTGICMSLIRRWFGLLGIALQHSIGVQTLTCIGSDLTTTLVEKIPNFFDLP